MNATPLATAVVALCAPVLAQGFITTPPGGLKEEGRQHTVGGFGWFKDARIQQADNSHTGGRAYSLTRIAFRLDYRKHNTSTAMGRTWTRVTLDIAETTNYSNFSRTWTKNITTTPTKVFDSRVTWPSQVGFPAQKPSVWDGASGRLGFPFKKPWVYSGKSAILMEYFFRGGRLANKAAFWTGHKIAGYYLDSEILITGRKFGTSLQLPAVAITCGDSAFAPNVPVFTSGYSQRYGPKANVVTLRNKLLVAHYSQFTAPSAQVVHAFGLGGSTTGVNIGAKCYRLHVDFQKPVVLIPLRTDSVGRSGIMAWSVPWDGAFARLDVYLQAAWADSKSNAFSLARAMRLTLPSGLPFSASYKTIHSFIPSSFAAMSPVFSSGEYFPFTKYTTR